MQSPILCLHGVGGVGDSPGQAHAAEVVRLELSELHRLAVCAKQKYLLKRADCARLVEFGGAQRGSKL
jgi:hypothetical protein